MLRRTGPLDPADVWLATTDADTLVPAAGCASSSRYADQGWDAVAGTVRVTDWSGTRRVPPLFRERYGAGPARTRMCTAPTWASAPRPT